MNGTDLRAVQILISHSPWLGVCNVSDGGEKVHKIVRISLLDIPSHVKQPLDIRKIHSRNQFTLSLSCDVGAAIVLWPPLAACQSPAAVTI